MGRPYIWRVKDKLIYKVFINKSNRKRPIGRHRQRWFDRVNKDLEYLITTRIEDADDREVWKELVEAGKSINGL